MSIGQKIFEIRKKKKITQRQLAEYLGVTPSYISHIEKGDRNITADILYKIARFLNVRMAVLMENSSPSSDLIYGMGELPDQIKTDISFCSKIHANLWELENIISGRPMVGSVLKVSDIAIAPSKAALEVRSILGMFPRFIIGKNDLIKNLSLHNINVFILPLDSIISGLSTRDPPTCIFINEGLSQYRQLFTLAQHLGYIVLHQRGLTLNQNLKRVTKEEEDTGEFALHFLMPEELLQTLLWNIPESLDRLETIRWLSECLKLDPMVVLIRLEQLGRISKLGLLELRRTLEATQEKMFQGVTSSFDPLKHLSDRYLTLVRLAFDKREISPAKLGDFLFSDIEKVMQVYNKLETKVIKSEDPQYYISLLHG